MPSRPVLANKYNVSRTTIDRAISELIGEGYLYAVDGSGTYITDYTKQSEGRNNEGNFASWGVIVPDIQKDTYPGILRGIEDIASANEINIIVCNSDNNKQKQLAYLNKLISLRVLGIIMVPAIVPEMSIAVFERLKQVGIPIVFCNRGVEGIEVPRVFSNNFYGAYIATKHLLSNGYRRIGYITRYWYSTAFERFQGYTSALAERGITVPESYYTFPVSENGSVNEKDAVHCLLKEKADSILCFNDSVAETVYWELDKEGCRIGKDFGLVGYDNTHICEKLPVKLTSVRFKTYQIGQEAAKLMLRINKGEKIPNNKTIILQPQLEIRQSSKKDA
jgi:DNA-binding LacI/PurR family transcriptional regulator